MKLICVVLLTACLAFAADTTVVVKAVNMETGIAADKHEGETYAWHSMLVEVDGTTYTIGDPRGGRGGWGFRINEQWLHKGTYTGRWKDKNRRMLEVDVPDGDKIRRHSFRVLGEQ